MTAKVFAILACSLAIAGCAGDKAPPSSALHNLNSNTPRNAVAKFYDAIEMENIAEVRAMLHATKKPYHIFADEYAMILVTNHHFCRLIDQRFPGKDLGDRWSDPAAMHRAREALTKATVTIRGDRATIVLPEEAIFLIPEDGRNELVRVGERWKINVDDIEYLANYPENVISHGDSAALIHLSARMSRVLDTVATDIENGKLVTWKEVEESAKERMRPIVKELGEGVE